MTVANTETGATREMEMGCLTETDVPWNVSSNGRYIYYVSILYKYVYDLVEGKGVKIIEFTGDVTDLIQREGFETVYSMREAADRMGGEGLDAEVVEMDNFTISADGSKAGFKMHGGPKPGWASMPISGLFDGSLPTTPDPSIDPQYPATPETCIYKSDFTSVTIRVHGDCVSVRVIPGTRETVKKLAVPLGRNYSHVDFWASDGNHYRYDLNAGQSKLVEPTSGVKAKRGDESQVVVVSARSS